MFRRSSNFFISNPPPLYTLTLFTYTSLFICRLTSVKPVPPTLKFGDKNESSSKHYGGGSRAVIESVKHSISTRCSNTNRIWRERSTLINQILPFAPLPPSPAPELPVVILIPSTTAIVNHWKKHSVIPSGKKPFKKEVKGLRKIWHPTTILVENPWGLTDPVLTWEWLGLQHKLFLAQLVNAEVFTTFLLEQRFCLSAQTFHSTPLPHAVAHHYLLT